MLEPDLAARAQRGAHRVSQLTEPTDPGYRGSDALTGRRLMSAQRREGSLISAALATAMAASDRYEVAQNVHVPVSATVRIVAAASADDTTPAEMRCSPGRGIRVDVMVLDTVTDIVYPLEVKRGVEHIGADHRRQIMSNLAALRIVGRDVAQQRFGRRVGAVRPFVISYYGATGIDAALTLTAADIDGFFGVDLTPVIDAHLDHFRYQLEALIPGITGYTAASRRARGRRARGAT